MPQPADDLVAERAGNEPAFLFDATLSTAIAADGERQATVPMPQGPLTPKMLDRIHRYWRAANYLCVGQIYLFENPLLRESLKAEQIKPTLLGHWGTSPGQNLIYVHLNRLQKTTSEHHLYFRTRARRSVAQRRLLSRWFVYRGSPGNHIG